MRGRNETFLYDGRNHNKGGDFYGSRKKKRENATGGIKKKSWWQLSRQRIDRPSWKSGLEGDRNPYSGRHFTFYHLLCVFLSNTIR